MQFLIHLELEDEAAVCHSILHQHIIISKGRRLSSEEARICMQKVLIKFLFALRDENFLRHPRALASATSFSNFISFSLFRSRSSPFVSVGNISFRFWHWFNVLAGPTRLTVTDAATATDWEKSFSPSFPLRFFAEHDDLVEINLPFAIPTSRLIFARRKEHLTQLERQKRRRKEKVYALRSERQVGRERREKLRRRGR